jgi:DNA repair exonuclease SbcCD ATPase subunit
MLALSTLEQQIQTLQTRYDRESGVLTSLEERLAITQGQLANTDQQIEIGEQVQLLFAKTSAFARAQIKTHVERAVTAALQAVFGREMRFEVSLRELGGQPAADWRVVDAVTDTNGAYEVSGDPEEARGGGVSDIVSLALRLAMLELVRPKPEGPIILDEVGKHVSAEHREALSEFLRAYAQQTGRQIILVTHMGELSIAADVVYQITRENGTSHARSVQVR